MSPEKPPGQPETDERRRIVVEVMIFALLFLIVGGAIVAIQVTRKGDRLLHFDPHGHER